MRLIQVMEPRRQRLAYAPWMTMPDAHPRLLEHLTSHLASTTVPLALDSPPRHRRLVRPRRLRHITRGLRFFADTFFAKRYGNRAIVLETVAAVPGMVGAHAHPPALPAPDARRRGLDPHADGRGRERAHAPDDVHRDRQAELVRTRAGAGRAGAFLHASSSSCTCCLPRTAHRLVGYFEEEAVISYTHYLAEIDAGRVDNVPAPAIAIDYWSLPRRRDACATWCWRCAPTRPAIATSTTASPTPCARPRRWARRASTDRPPTPLSRNPPCPCSTTTSRS